MINGIEQLYKLSNYEYHDEGVVVRSDVKCYEMAVKFFEEANKHLFIDEEICFSLANDGSICFEFIFRKDERIGGQIYSNRFIYSGIFHNNRISGREILPFSDDILVRGYFWDILNYFCRNK